jgi:hypothetical protein
MEREVKLKEGPAAKARMPAIMKVIGGIQRESSRESIDPPENWRFELRISNRDAKGAESADGLSGFKSLG